MSSPAVALTAEEELQEEIGTYFSDPLGYCMFAWDWDGDPSLQVVKMPEPWASKYNSEFGLDGWQCEFMERLGEMIRERGFNPDEPVTVKPVRKAVTSGHGIGKSAGTGMLSSFLLDTRPGSHGIVTANTGTQLHTKTWAQIKKWKAKAVTAHWWRILENSILSRAGRDAGSLDAITWDRRISEAFAGQHAVDASSFYIFDEASAVHDDIWEVANGGLTDGEPFMFVFGNPTRNTGAFYKCFHRQRHRWDTQQIDSRDSQITNKEEFQEWIDDYGIDSDFVRVRVLGKFPRASAQQLMPTDVVAAAMRRKVPHVNENEPVVMGLDVAREGDDESVLAIRRGMDARTIPWHFWREGDSMKLADSVAEEFNALKRIGQTPLHIAVDGGGVGGPVGDRLVQLGFPVVFVNFGGTPMDEGKYLRKDAEMWVTTREMMKQRNLAIPDDEVLAEQLTARIKDYTDTQRMFLWSKKRMKKELSMDSPDRADALVMLFAVPLGMQTQEEREQGYQTAQTEDNPWA